ncbi:MAG: ATP-binding protein [Coriobacteriia bacterium]|nr:ATP-binding protein [Coriobacteriia bacterium]
MAVQLAAAVVAILSIKVSGKRLAWILLTCGLLVQLERRLFILITGIGTSLLHEAVTAFVVSVLILVGVLGVRLMFHSLNRCAVRLEDERNRTQLYLDTAEVMFVVLDSNGIVELVNPKVCEILGRPTSEIVGTPWIDTFVPEVAREDVREVFASLMAGETGPVEYYENAVIGSDGDERLIAWRNTLLRDDAGAVVGTLGSGEDITERVSIEDDLRRLNAELETLVEARTCDLEKMNQELSEANETKSRFLASMSHELRTPLNSVIGFSGIMLDGLTGEITEEQHRQLGMIRDSGQHLLALVNDVLDLSKIEAGEVALKVSCFSICELITKTVDLVRFGAEEKGLELEVVCPCKDEQLCTDMRAVEQVLINLLGNAVKFTDEGTVRIDVSMTDEGRAVFRVSDTGVGIPAEDRERIFEPFERTRLSGSQGTGLGLAISSRLAAELGGSLSVESQLGVGSTFTLDIPTRIDDHESGV